MSKKGLTQLILSVLLMSAFGPITYVAKSADTTTATTAPAPAPAPAKTESTTATTAPAPAKTESTTATTAPAPAKTETTTATTSPAPAKTETTTATTSPAPAPVTNKIDVALAIEAILYGAQYFGSTTANTKEQYDQLRWYDTRISKPTWEALLNAWNNLLAVRLPIKKIESTTAQLDPTTQTDTKTATTQTDTKTATTKPITTTQSETKTAALAAVAAISNVESRTVTASNLLTTYTATEKEDLLNVVVKSTKSAVINVSTDIPNIKMVVTATKVGSKPIVFKVKTDDDGDTQVKTSKNLTGYTVTLSANGVKLDSDKAIKK